MDEMDMLINRIEELTLTDEEIRNASKEDLLTYIDLMEKIKARIETLAEMKGE